MQANLAFPTFSDTLNTCSKYDRCEFKNRDVQRPFGDQRQAQQGLRNGTNRSNTVGWHES